MLPPPCEQCRPHDWNWVLTDSGLARCWCARGRALRELDRKPKHKTIKPAHTEPLLDYAQRAAGDTQ